jgi:hypothetical protein
MVLLLFSLKESGGPVANQVWAQITHGTSFGTAIGAMPQL